MSYHFKVFLNCLQLIESNKKDEQFSQMCLDVIDWKKFINLVQWHKMTPLVYKMLKTFYAENIPSTEMHILKSHCDKNSFRVLKLSTELLRIGKLFQRENLPFILLKGPLLSQRIYGDLTLREPRDLDLLIPKDCLLKAHRLLLSQGYQLYLPKILPKYLSLYTKYQKDFNYFHPSKHIFIELHWRLFNNQHEFIYPINQIFEEAEVESLLGFPIAKMSSEIEILYLLHHGASHSWSRLCWLYDVKQYLNQHPIMHGLNLLELARSIGIEHSFLGGLTLANELLHTPLDFIFDKNIYQNKKIRAITKASSFITIQSKKPNLLMRWHILKNRFPRKIHTFPFYQSFIMRLLLRLFKFIPA